MKFLRRILVWLGLAVPLRLPLPADVAASIREDFARGVSVQEIVKKRDVTLVAVLHAIADMRRTA